MRGIARTTIFLVRSVSFRPAARAGSTSFFRFFTHTSTNHTFDDDDMGKKDKASKSNIQLKVPKGTKDWDGKDMVIREEIFSKITKVFKRHGAVTIDTSVPPQWPLRAV